MTRLLRLAAIPMLLVGNTSCFAWGLQVQVGGHSFTMNGRLDTHTIATVGTGYARLPGAQCQYDMQCPSQYCHGGFCVFRHDRPSHYRDKDLPPHIHYNWCEHDHPVLTGEMRNWQNRFVGIIPPGRGHNCPPPVIGTYSEEWKMPIQSDVYPPYRTSRPRP